MDGTTRAGAAVNGKGDDPRFRELVDAYRRELAEPEGGADYEDVEAARSETQLKEIEVIDYYIGQLAN